MEIVELGIEEIREYPGNPRKIEAAVDKVAESIRQFGFVNPIAINQDRYIISGHTRYRAAKKLGLEKVPCIIHSLSEEDARLARILDNKSSEYATWDSKKLDIEIEELKLEDISFFRPSRKALSKKKSLVLKWGKNAIPVTMDECKEFEKRYYAYIAEHDSYLGFVEDLLRGEGSCIE